MPTLKMMAKCMENIKGAEEDISLVYGLEKLKKEIAYFEQIIAANIGKQKVVGEQLAEIKNSSAKPRGLQPLVCETQRARLPERAL